MKFHNFGARAILLSSVALCAATASAQTLRSSITTFDKNGKAIIQPTSGEDPTRSSVTTFDDQGVPHITYTSPALAPYTVPNSVPSGIQQPKSVGELIANQNIYGQSAPNPTPGNYTRFGYNYAPVYPQGYGYAAPGYGYGYPAPGYGYPAPAYPVQQPPYSITFNDSNLPWTVPSSITSIPLGPNYAYPAPGYPTPYPYGYPAPGYGYPVQTYPYPYGGYGGNYSSNSTGYGIRFGRGGFSASIGGNNTTSRSNTTTTITTR